MKNSLKHACQLKKFYYSKLMKNVLNGRTLKYHFWGGKFHMFPEPYQFSHGLCLNFFFKFFSYVIKDIRLPHSDILIGMMKCILWLEAVKC